MSLWKGAVKLQLSYAAVEGTGGTFHENKDVLSRIIKLLKYYRKPLNLRGIALEVLIGSELF